MDKRKTLKVTPEVWQKIDDFRRKNETMSGAIDRMFIYIEKIATILPMMENSLRKPESK
jgi:cytochrome c556